MSHPTNKDTVSPNHNPMQPHSSNCAPKYSNDARSNHTRVYNNDSQQSILRALLCSHDTSYYPIIVNSRCCKCKNTNRTYYGRFDHMDGFCIRQCRRIRTDHVCLIRNHFDTSIRNRLVCRCRSVHMVMVLKCIRLFLKQ